MSDSEEAEKLPKSVIRSDNWVLWFIVSVLVTLAFVVVAACVTDPEESRSPSTSVPTLTRYSPSPTPKPDPVQTGIAVQTAAAAYRATVPTAHPSPGLGVSRSDIQAPFERVGLEFYQNEILDENDRLVDRWVGDSRDTFVMLGLYGPADELTKIDIEVGIPIDLEQTTYLTILLELVLPTWDDGGDWIIANLASAQRGEKPATQHGRMTIELSYLSLTDWLTVSITGH